MSIKFLLKVQVLSEFIQTLSKGVPFDSVFVYLTKIYHIMEVDASYFE